MFKSYEDFVNEAKVQLKRKYTENYPAKHVYASTKVRNIILDSIKDGVVSKEEFSRIVKEAGASDSWVRKYSGFFNMNETEVSLSKQGMKVWKGINPTPITEAVSKERIEAHQEKILKLRKEVDSMMKSLHKVLDAKDLKEGMPVGSTISDLDEEYENFLEVMDKYLDHVKTAP
jgi:hypothetical protein